jgi:hypothetical protein
MLGQRRARWSPAVEEVLSRAEGFSVCVFGKSEMSPVNRAMADGIRKMSDHEVSGGTDLVHGTALIRGVLWYAVDALAEAHEVFQEEAGFLGSYCHGMMHRREGDFWNANYWFRSAGKVPEGLFEHPFDPVKLTAECERDKKSPAAGAGVLNRLSWEAARVMDRLFTARR